MEKNSSTAPAPQTTQQAPSGAARARSSPLLAVARIVAVIFLSCVALLALVLNVAIARGDKRRLAVAARWTRKWGEWACGVLGIEVITHGPEPPAGSLLVSNHVSYLDIISLSSATGCFFTPKAELRTWPLVGMFIRLSGHPFVRRAAGKDLLVANGEVRRRLEAGRRVCAFLEGTTTGGDRILPFRPTLLQPAIEIGAPITPVALRWSASDPGAIVSEDVAYWKDHVFGPHVWRVAGLRGLRIDIHFGPPLQAANEHRRDLAEFLRRESLRMAGLSDH